MEPRALAIEIRLLGPVELRVDGQTVPLGGPRQRALLSLLAMRAGQTIPADELIEEIWSGDPPDGAETTLRSYVSRLRQSLGSTASIDAANRGYALRVPADVVDVFAFERLVREGGETLARGAARRARERFIEAFALWRGRPFAELGTDGALAAAAERLDELRLLAVEWRLEADLDTGRSAELVEELERLVREQPFRERLWRHLMLALYRAGRQADALAAYHRARAALDDLGIEPGEELRSLEAGILRHAVPPATTGADGSRIRESLPVALTSFIGRVDELEQVGRLVRRHRLVTLTGVGGVGKTRLALVVAREGAAAFADGVAFVDLAPLADPALVTTQLAGALDIRESSSGSPVDSILAEVRDRELLIVLDNCEHLRDACASLVAMLLARAPHAHVLATSRVTLGVPGEVDVAVSPLSLPAREQADGSGGASDAVDLFFERARAARPSLSDDAATRAAVARIVEDLDGLPLAIELAAARAKALSVGDIAARLGDRFRFLVSWRRLASARHRTLAEAMAWSFDLLEPAEQSLLADLSVFAGSFDLDAVGAICLDGDVSRAVDMVQQLVEASLVVAETDAQGSSRYRLLETVRQYALERLGAAGRTGAVRAAHAAYFTAVAETTPNRGAEQARGMARLDAELDNLRAAMDTAVDLGDHAVLRRMTAALWRYWHVRGLLVEGRARLGAAVATGPGDASDLYAGVLTGAAKIAWSIGDYAEGNQYAGDLLALADASGSTTLAHTAHSILGNIAGRQHDFELSERHSLRALELGREIGDELSLLMTENNHAALLMDSGRIEPAVAMLTHVLGRFRALGDTTGAAYALLNLGEAAFRRGADDEARRWFTDAREAFEAVGFGAHVGHAIQGLAAVEARSGQATLAAEYLGQAAALLDKAGHALDDFNPAIVASAADAARGSIGEAAYAAAYGEGWSRESSRAGG